MSLNNYIARTPRRPLVVAGIVLVALQLMLAGHIQVLGCSPHFLLVLASVFSLSLGPVAGMAGGFALGLLADLLGAAPVGVSALLYCVAFFLVNGGGRNMLAEGWRVPAVLTSIVSLAYNVLYLVVLFVMGTTVSAGSGVVSTVAVSFLLDAVVASLTCLALSRSFTSGQLSSRGLH